MEYGNVGLADRNDRHVEVGILRYHIAIIMGET